jgi:hypothetical protein
LPLTSKGETDSKISERSYGAADEERTDTDKDNVFEPFRFNLLGLFDNFGLVNFVYRATITVNLKSDSINQESTHICSPPLIIAV